MKGPGGRLRFDIRRLWECPACRRRELTPGDVVSRLCSCSGKSDLPRQNWMRLLEQKPARPTPPAALQPSVEPAAVVTEAAQESPPPQVSPIPPAGDSPTPHGS